MNVDVPARAIGHTPSNVDTVGPELLTLSPDERQELADELYESLVDTSHDPEWQRRWSDEIEQRMKDVVQNRVELLDADDVHRELRAELRDTRR